MIGLWIAAGLAAWIVIAVPVAIVIGRSVRVTEGTPFRPSGPIDQRLVYRCARCDRRVAYSSEMLVDSVGRVHELDCTPAVRA